MQNIVQKSKEDMSAVYNDINQLIMNATSSFKYGFKLK
jgi:hypothetical protein